MVQLYGPDGRPISADRKPITREIAVASIRDQWSSYPSQGLTPGRLARIFREADGGDVSRQAELFEEMEEKDTHLYSVLGTRKNAVLGLDWRVMPASEAAKDQQVAAFVQQVLDGIPGFEEALLDLLDAIGKGFGATEIIWAIRDGQAVVDALQWVHQKRFLWWQGVELRVLTDEDPAQGIPLPPGKFIFHRYKSKSGHPSRAGVLRVAAWMYLFKNYSLKDWVSFAEVYGMPLRLGKYDSSASPEDKEVLRQAVTQIGADAAGIISKNTEIEFITGKSGSSQDNVYEGLANFCNNEMSKAVLGQTLTTDVGSTGSYAASKTHGDVRQDILEADSKALAATLVRDLLTPIVRYNFGAAAVPWVKFDVEPPEDRRAEAETYAILVRDVGLPIAADHVYEKFGVPKPKAGEPILTPAPSAAAAVPAKAPVPMTAVAMAAPHGHDPQPAVDGLADQVLAQGVQAIQAMQEPIRRAIEEAGSLEELRQRLVEAYADLPTGELETLLERALFAADLYGRLMVTQHG